MTEADIRRVGDDIPLDLCNLKVHYYSWKSAFSPRPVPKIRLSKI